MFPAVKPNASLRNIGGMKLTGGGEGWGARENPYQIAAFCTVNLSCIGRDMNSDLLDETSATDRLSQGTLPNRITSLSDLPYCLFFEITFTADCVLDGGRILLVFG